MSARDFMKNDFGGNRFKDEEEADPRVGLVNLADVMLVFACGLMVALVAHYNVDIAPTVEVEGERTEITSEDVEKMQDEQNGSGPALQERGKVYEDPTTGQLYLIEAEEDDGAPTEWDQSDSAYAQPTDDTDDDNGTESDNG